MASHKMSDPVSDPVSASKVIGWLAFGFIGLLSWIGKRLVSRVSVLESKVVDRVEYNETIKSLRKEMKDGHQQTQNLIIDLYKNQGNKG